jgi:hypothetical protein
VLISAIECPICRAGLPAHFAQAGIAPEHFDRCPSCGMSVAAVLFPAAWATQESAPAAAVLGGDAACFFHGEKRATLACDECGRFLCSLCDLEIGGRHVCPECAQRPTTAGAEPAPWGRERTLHDSAALALAVYPLLVFYLTVVTAPIVLFLAVRHWHSPQGPVPRRRWRMPLAATIASLEIAGWITLVVTLVVSFRAATP